MRIIKGLVAGAVIALTVGGTVGAQPPGNGHCDNGGHDNGHVDDCDPPWWWPKPDPDDPDPPPPPPEDPNFIVGTPVRDLLIGTPGIDVILARQGNDMLVGWRGDDFLIGQRGNDTLRAAGPFGRSGEDVLRGGLGTDRCIGDSSDHFFGCETIIIRDAAPPGPSPV